MKKSVNLLLLVLILFWGTGCVYYNTFYLARKAFNEGESKRKDAGRGGERAGNTYYKKAITKSDKILEKYPTSKWYDDALFVNGVSHYWTEDFSKAQKRFRELVANYPESKYIKESRLYLAKSKLRLDHIEEAKDLFEELFLEVKDKWIKAEAAMALAEYFFERKEYDLAEPYFGSLIDSLGNDDEKNISRMYIADGYYNRFKYKKAIEAYTDLLKQELTSKDEYKTKFRIGECLLFLNDIESGLDIFFELAENDLYFDSLPSLKLMIAQGYEWEGDLELAEETYEEIVVESPAHSKQGAYSSYILGLINQYDHENYEKAKEYYDKAKAAGSKSGIYEDALLRSSNIGKLEEYQKMEFKLDSTSTQEEVDNAAETQYLLAELYLMEMAKPDSSRQEFQYIIDNFPDAYLAPKTRIALAVMSRDYYFDTLTYDTMLRGVLRDFPKSDFIPEAVDLLGLSGTIADSGYASLYYEKSEHFLFIDTNLDSARFYMSIVADSFPYSKLNEKAKYALLWMTEEYDSRDDSTLYYAYAYYADSFPDTDYGRAANKKIKIKPKIRQEDEVDEETEYANGEIEEGGGPGAGIDSGIDDDIGGFKTPEELCATGPDGNTIFPVGMPPMRYDKEFRFPLACLGMDLPNTFELCFQVKIDPFGEVDDLKLITPSPCEELNEEATETVLTGHFETYWIQPEFADSWFYFKYKVVVPTG